MELMAERIMNVCVVCVVCVLQDVCSWALGGGTASGEPHGHRLESVRNGDGSVVWCGSPEWRV